jgi:hypothetical protein
MVTFAMNLVIARHLTPEAYGVRAPRVERKPTPTTCGPPEAVGAAPARRPAPPGRRVLRAAPCPMRAYTHHAH